MVPPWTWQNTSQTATAQMYYHLVLTANPYQETHLTHSGMTHTPAILGVNVVGRTGNMSWNANGSSHQYAAAVL